MTIIPREAYLGQLTASVHRSVITALIGPRQCGKSTLARQFIKLSTAKAYYDLENPDDLARLHSPMRELEVRQGLVVIDEIQRRPDLMMILRVLADRRPIPARFLILGSASPTLKKSSAETLAGRIEYVEMSGFNLWELSKQYQRRLWIRGGFPNSYLADAEEDSLIWRQNFIRTFLEREMPQMGINIPAQMLRNFWTMTAHYHGQVWNGNEIGRSLGIAHTTAKRYLDFMCGALVMRQLPPWFENIGKRIVKSPKVYLRDTGILHALLRLPDYDAVAGHPKLGSSWEGFALEQIITIVGEHNVYFWATHAGAELDLLLFLRGKRIGVEFKYADAPLPTRSMHTALNDLKLDHLFIVHPGEQTYSSHDRIEGIPLSAVKEKLSAL
jgi:predicted AAA+ superfamily ATPase